MTFIIENALLGEREREREGLFYFSVNFVVEGSLRDPQKRSLREPEKGSLRYPQTHDMQVLRIPFCREDIFITIFFHAMGKMRFPKSPKNK